MQVNYPKRFSYSGLIEIAYKDYATEIRNRYDRKSGYSVLQHRYSLAVQGYIYHPKLAIFSSRVTFMYNDMFNSTSSFEPDSRNMTYELSAVFLPYRPVSLTTYVTVNDFSVDSFSWGNPLDNRIVNYGGILGINFKNYPTIRFEYYHLDITPTGSQLNKGKTMNDSYYLIIKGTLLKLKTQYSINFGLIDINNSNAKFSNKYAHLSASTTFNKFSWINFLRYTDQESLKFYGIYSNLQFNGWEKFASSYFYSYERQENPSTSASGKIDKQELRGSFSYIFQRNLRASLSLNYGIINDDDKKSKYNTISTMLHYSSPIKNHYFTSFYRFTLRDDELRTSYTEHTASLQLASKSYKWGTFFTTYFVTLLDGSFKFRLQETESSSPEEKLETGYFKSTTHTFVLGLRGRAFKRASWIVEAQYVHATSSRKRPVNFVDYYDILESDMLEIYQKKDYYVLVGEMFYPIGKRGSMLTLRVGDNFGKIDSISYDKKYYEIHFNWPVARKLRITSWWKEAWYDHANNIHTKVRDYSLIANYRIGKLFLDGEYWVREETDESHYKKDTRMILKVKRQF